ncbi:MAG: FG-GAP and VCBS repeat-containing protein [Burkholderiales bacterium]
MPTRSVRIARAAVFAIAFGATTAHAGWTRDFNGDGKTDLVWTTQFGWLIWYMNGLDVASKGGWEPGGGKAIGPSYLHATGDYDGDGMTDLTSSWFACSPACSGGIETRLSSGGSYFHPATMWLFADFDGNGRSDTISAEAAGWTVRLSGSTSGNVIFSGGGGWVPFVSAPPRAPDFDFNGDGKSDLLWINPAGAVAVWLMNGATTIEARMLWDQPGWRVIAVGDFNGDGKSDILWRSDAGETAIWLMNGSTALSATVILGASNWFPEHVGDFDGDGRDDILWRDAFAGESAVWLMDGAAARAGAVIFTAFEWQVVQVGDFDGDGKEDLLWRGPNDQQAVWLMNGLGSKSAGYLPPAPVSSQLR